MESMNRIKDDNYYITKLITSVYWQSTVGVFE